MYYLDRIQHAQRQRFSGAEQCRPNFLCGRFLLFPILYYRSRFLAALRGNDNGGVIFRRQLARPLQAQVG
jgi:hypothetical protein